MHSNSDLFESLHTDHHQMVHQMCLGFMKGNMDLAKDLTQEAFINVWRALDKFRGASSHKTWIYRVTVNTCLNYIRDKKKRSQVSLNEETHNVPDLSSTSKNPHHELYQAIGKLAKIDRLIIMMMLDELPYSEIAEVVGLSEGNLRVKIHRIKKNLKKILENE